MEKRSSSLEDHLNIIVSGHSKTAGVKGDKAGASLLDKLASELGLPEAEKTAAAGITAPAAPTAEGEVSPAESSVAGAAAPVVAATEAVTVPQMTIAGGNPAEAAAGEIPATTKPNEGLAISAGDGKVTDANNINKTPEAVAAAAMGGGGDEGSAAAIAPEKASAVPENVKTAAEAQQIGEMIAKSFQETLQKEAEAREYSEALGILKEAGLLEGYDIKDEGMDKTASVIEGSLEKLANKEGLSRAGVISAAVEYVELEKQAADADAQGREDAHALVGLVQEIQKTAAPEAPVEDGQEKIAALLKDPQVVESVKVLREKGVI